jgi:hypothetical protein
VALFTVAVARAELARLLPVLDAIIAMRADAAELATALAQDCEPTALGGLPEFKAAQARLDEMLSQVQQTGVTLEIDGVPVLLCWLEGDRSLSWYHRLDLGFAGRRPLPEGAG